MVKIPTIGGGDIEGVEQRTQFLHDLGILIALWGKVEMHIECEIWKITKMEMLHASIVLGTLQHKAKISILYALLRLEGRDDAISHLKTAMSFAKRNALMHGTLASEHDFTKFSFFTRSVDDRYRVKRHDYNAATFHDHVWQFRELASAAVDCLTVTHDQLEEICTSGAIRRARDLTSP
ncbi:hypothetical protein D3Y57_07205 [Sphingomonas paeninsulae]|uniref:Uncharacterized protein n=1 Tax=Sphingomonas paeninsulae TaxID=2319844 RepID=A0A494T9Z1_SPHPE|nr:hypothetical protein [Sphingomonas paeninsulae]AYJ85800.1 hypothetical protein D3Y57_07205 [Sphingomonas paeninsulae]